MPMGRFGKECRGNVKWRKNVLQNKTGNRMKIKVLMVVGRRCGKSTVLASI